MQARENFPRTGLWMNCGLSGHMRAMKKLAARRSVYAENKTLRLGRQEQICLDCADVGQIDLPRGRGWQPDSDILQKNQGPHLTS
jgi:hypothetical protein